MNRKERKIKLKKINIKHIVHIIVLGLYVSSVGYAQNVENIFAEKELRVGDVAKYILLINRKSISEKIILPDSSAFGDNFDVLSRKHYRLNNYRDSVVYTLQFWGREDGSIPKIPVVFQNIAENSKTLYSLPIPYTFLSIVPDTATKPKPLKPLYEAVWIFPWRWVIIIGSILIIITILYFLWKKFKPKKKETIPTQKTKHIPFISPIEELALALDNLKNDPSIVYERDLKPFYVSLGDAIRQYYERLYDIPALESTSYELLTMIKERHIDTTMIEYTYEILNKADQVKFAKFKATIQEAEESLKIGYMFLRKAKDLHIERINELRQKHYELHYNPDDQENRPI